MTQEKAIIGCLLGTAVGDAFGLPYEGLTGQKQQKLAPNLDKHRFLGNKGMFSDDTEHTCMVAQSLIVSAGDERLFARSLGWRLRWWLLGLPAAVGFATLRAIVKLWLGFSPRHSGVFSAGNGAAMRSAILGVCYGENRQKLRSLVKINTRITHRDPKAEWGALAIAIASYLATTPALITPETYYQTLEGFLDSEATEFKDLIGKACISAAKGETGVDFAASLGLTKGISGYIYHTVPVVIQIWLRHQTDYQQGITEIIRLGGDTDTTAAILGGIIGAKVGKTGIPAHWLINIWEYPRSISWLERLGIRLAEVIDQNQSQSPVSLLIPALIVRNLIFLLIVIGHGFYRLTLL